MIDNQVQRDKKVYDLAERFLAILLIVMLLTLMASDTQGQERRTFNVGQKSEAYEIMECFPNGEGPFPAVLYTGGSILDAMGIDAVEKIGYKITGICQAFAVAGYATFIPLRERIRTARGGYVRYDPRYKDIIDAAINYAKGFTNVDQGKVSLVGYSMGGLVALIVAEDRKDLRSVVVMAPASRNWPFGTTVRYASDLNAPILLIVEKGDDLWITRGVDELEAAFQKYHKDAKVIRYDRGGGHNLFFSPDYYWQDVIDFLRSK